MPAQPILSPSAAPQKTPGSTWSPLQEQQEKNTGTLLQQHESELNSSIPSFLKDSTSSIPSPSKLFDDYQSTQDPMFKKAAGSALIALTTLAGGAASIFDHDPTYDRTEQIEKEIPQTISNNSKQMAYDAGNHYSVDPSLLAEQLKRENVLENPKAVNHNRDGTKDLGLMQINSSIIPYITAQFAKQGKKFNWQDPYDSMEAAAMIHAQNKSILNNMHIDPTDKNLFEAYNVGPQGLRNALRGNRVATTEIEKYDKGSMFQ